MKKTRKARAKSATSVEKTGMWVVALIILIAIASYATKWLPGSQAATPTKIVFTAPTLDVDWDYGQKNTVTFTWNQSALEPKPMAVIFSVLDYHGHSATIQKMTLPPGARNGYFAWKTGFDVSGKPISWLPANEVYLTARIVNGELSNSKPFNVMPADKGDGLPIVYFIHPNRGWSEGGTKVDIHGRNLLDANQMTTVWFDDKPAVFRVGGTTPDGRKLVVLTPSRTHDPLNVDVKVENDRGSYKVKDGFLYVTRI